MRESLQQACAPFQEQAKFIQELQAQGISVHFMRREWWLVRTNRDDMVRIEPHRWLAHKGSFQCLLLGTPEEMVGQLLGFWGTPHEKPGRKAKPCA